MITLTKLLLVRHGESRANYERFFAGQLDIELTAAGIQQAKLTAQYIKKNYDVSKVYSSDLSRAFETGKCISDSFGIEIIPIKQLREIYAGKWQGMGIDEIQTKYSDDYKVWFNDIGNAKCTDGESIKEMTHRVMSEITKIAVANPERTIVIASHANPVRAILCMAETDSFDHMKNIPCPTNASVSELEYNNGCWTVKKISLDAHLSNFTDSLHTFA